MNIFKALELQQNLKDLKAPRLYGHYTRGFYVFLKDFVMFGKRHRIGDIVLLDEDALINIASNYNISEVLGEINNGYYGRSAI